MSDANTLAGTLVLPKTSDLEMLASGVLEWYSAAQHFYPWFASYNPFEIMVAEVLLQRTQAARVASLFLRFIGKYSTPHILENAEIDEMQMDLRSFGLAKRAALLIRLG